MYSQKDEVMLHCPVLQGFVEIQSSSDAHDVDWRIIVNGVNKSTLMSMSHRNKMYNVSKADRLKLHMSQ